MNDFILVHAINDYLKYNPMLLRVSNIESVEVSESNGKTYIYTKKSPCYEVKETVEEVFKLIKENE